MTRRGLVFFLSAVLGAAAAGSQTPSPALSLVADPAADEAANFLAGRACRTAAWKALQETDDYQAYAAALEASWAELEAKRLRPMAAWAAAEMGEAVGETETLFYPFGGPDLLTALVLFPKAGTYILQGLEYVGRLPAFEGGTGAARVKPYTRNLFDTLSDFFKKSYFATKRMEASPGGDKVDGVLPLLVLFLKRTNHDIASVRRLDLLETGEVEESPYPGERPRFRRPYGVKISFFAAGSGRLRTLVYFSADFVDSVFRPDSAFLRYLEALPFETAFIKSASYLMHFREFSNIRGILLRRCRFLLQDDTGIPFRHFSDEDWDIRLYGEYAKPAGDFAGVEQIDLRTAFADPARVRPLPFQLGSPRSAGKDAVIYLRRKTHEHP
ncbi:MAG: hypothetical protein FJY82_08030 [Candidatus Aminicenantes bacterium]|nr:hypothetical protein [Candidatus Aminicenantes bacterium]